MKSWESAGPLWILGVIHSALRICGQFALADVPARLRDHLTGACVRSPCSCVCVSTAQTTIQTHLLFNRRICEVVHPRGRGLWCVCLTDFGRHVGWAAPTLTFNGIPMWIFPLATLCWSREGRIAVIVMCSLKFRFGTICDSFRGRQILGSNIFYKYFSENSLLLLVSSWLTAYYNNFITLEH